MPTLATALRSAMGALSDAGIPNAAVDARLLLCAAAAIDRTALIADPDRPLGIEAADRLENYVARRLAREPVSRILGRRGFWSLDLRVAPDVLDPRPDTETLVEAALARVGPRKGEPLRLLDLGTGSGAILCALLAELPAAIGWAVDRSAVACRAASGNLRDCGLAARGLVVRGDWAGGFPSQAFDLVVSNPPYVETDAISGLDREVRDHDPRAALDGGPDGLDAYRALATEAPRLLRPDGALFLEVGRGQSGAVAHLLAAAGLDPLPPRRDLAGIERVVAGTRPSLTVP